MIEIPLYRHVVSLTLPSNILVSMTTVGTRCSQIICQKSSTEFSAGPIRNGVKWQILSNLSSQTLRSYVDLSSFVTLKTRC
jgi:hypothetical protein